jgi:hypothetical protein
VWPIGQCSRTPAFRTLFGITHTGPSHFRHLYEDRWVLSSLCMVIMRTHPALVFFYPYKNWPGRPRTAEETCTNEEMSEKHIASVWGFGEFPATWHYVSLSHEYKRQQGLSAVSVNYAVSVLLANLHVCYHGSEVGLRFGLDPPLAREYLHPELPCPPLILD